MNRQSAPVVVLVLGILSLVGFGCLAGAPAWYLGNVALTQIAAGQIDRSQYSMVQAGRWMGIVTTFLSCCVLPCLLLAARLTAASVMDLDPFGRMGPEKMQEIIGEIEKDSVGENRREDLLLKVKWVRMAEPSKSYASIAKELELAKEKGAKWRGIDLAPSKDCGPYTFQAESGAFTVRDDCGESRLYGWPPK